MFRRWVLSILVGLFLTASPARADIRVSLLSEGGSPKNESSDVQYTRLGSAESAEKVWKGMPIFPLDQVSCPKGSVQVEISGSKSTLRLSGPFRLIVIGEVLGQMFYTLLSGDLDVLATGPTEMVGLGGLRSKHTLYGVRLAADSGEVRYSCVVYDGEIEFGAGPDSTRVLAGQSLTVPPRGARQLAPTAETDLQQTARLFASMDAAKAIDAGIEPKTAEEQREVLQERYVQVLRRPDDADARSNLGVTQIALRLPAQALYQLDRAEQQGPELAVKQRGVNVAARGEAYMQLGQPEKAQAVVTEAKQKNPSEDVPRQIESGKNLVVQVRDPASVKDSNAYLFSLLEAKKYEEAAVGFSGRIRSGGANARDHYGLAMAQANLRQLKPASLNASIALKMDEEQRLLTEKERGYAAKLARAVPQSLRTRYPVNIP